MNRTFQIIRNLFSIIGLLAVVGICIFFLTQHILKSPPETEVFRLSSPNKEYDSVVTNQESGMSFGSPWLRLYVVPAGTPFDKKNENFKWEVLVSDSILVDKIKWRNDRTLMVYQSTSGQIVRFVPVYYDLRDTKENPAGEKYWRKVTVLLQTYEEVSSAAQIENYSLSSKKDTKGR